MRIELLGGTSREELENRIKVVASSGKLSRFPGNVFEVLEQSNDYEANLKMIKRIIKMGHKSIIEHDYLVFAISDVTPIVEQTIISTRLASFTIKSRREVDFRNAGFFVPKFRGKDVQAMENQEELEAKYKAHMNYLFDEYAQMVDAGIPGEDARFLLPYSFYSNIIMGLDARELENLIDYLTTGEVSGITELYELGKKMADLAKEYVPYLELCVSEDNRMPVSTFDGLFDDKNMKILNNPKLIKHTNKVDKTIMLSSVMGRCQYSLNEARVFLIEKCVDEGMNFEASFMASILEKSQARELEQVSFTFQVPISLAVLTHLTRHRMHSLITPDFVPLWNFDNFLVPPSIQRSSFKEKFIHNAKENKRIMEDFREAGVCDEDLVYFYLSAQMCNVITTMNGRALQWIARMRCCTKAQWQIRGIVTGMVNEVKRIAPLYGRGLGPTCVTMGKCFEGKESCGRINNLKR